MKWLFTLLSLLIITGCKKKEVNIPENTYFPLVKTIIQNHCFSCHNSAGTWEGRPVSFDNDSLISASYISIKQVVADPTTPGVGGNKRMPPTGPLNQNDIDVIVKWFNKGGKTSD